MRLIHGDSLPIMDSFIEIGVEFDMIFTDPPYKMTARGNSGNTGGMLKKSINKQGRVFKHNDVDISQYASKLYSLLKDGGHLYIMTNHVNLISMLNELTSAGFHFIKSLIWDKCNKIMGRFYMSQFEYILFLRKGTGVKINNCGTPDILTIPNIKSKGADSGNLHDTEKPVQLIEILIGNSTVKGETVFDPFMGIGSTGVACRNLNREFTGVEIDKPFFDIAENRIRSRESFSSSFC